MPKTLPMSPCTEFPEFRGKGSQAQLTWEVIRKSPNNRLSADPKPHAGFSARLPVRASVVLGRLGVTLCLLRVVSGQSGDGRPASVQWSNPDCQYTLPTPREVAAHVGATAAGRFSAS